MTVEDIKRYIMKETIDVNTEISEMEEYFRKLGIRKEHLLGDKVYVALLSKKQTLREILDYIM